MNRTAKRGRSYICSERLQCRFDSIRCRFAEQHSVCSQMASLQMTYTPDCLFHRRRSVILCGSLLDQGREMGGPFRVHPHLKVNRDWSLSLRTRIIDYAFFVVVIGDQSLSTLFQLGCRFRLVSSVELLIWLRSISIIISSSSTSALLSKLKSMRTNRRKCFILVFRLENIQCLEMAPKRQNTSTQSRSWMNR